MNRRILGSLVALAVASATLFGVQQYAQADSTDIGTQQKVKCYDSNDVVFYVKSGTQSHENYYVSSPVSLTWPAGNRTFSKQCTNKYGNLWYKVSGMDDWIYTANLS